MLSNKLTEVLKIQSHTCQQFRMFRYLIRQLKSIPDCRYYTKRGNLYVTKGKARRYPAVVAHMDTVHPIVEDLSLIQSGNLITGFNRVTMTQTGIGGDDKVGIYIALQCLTVFKKIKVAFFRDEESGCKGSAVADLPFFNNCNFILQCDRMNNHDFITVGAGVELSSKKFQNTIRAMIGRKKYRFSKGSLTDVVMLKTLGIGCCVANISCGYYRPHTIEEYVDIVDVENCLQLVTSLIQKYGNTYFPHEYEQQSSQLFCHSFEVLCSKCMNELAGRNGLCSECNGYYYHRWNSF